MKKGFAFWSGQLIAVALAAGIVLSLPFTLAARDLGAVLFSQDRVQAILQSRLLDSGLLDRVLVNTLFGEDGLSGADNWYRSAVEHLSEPERQELLQMLVPSGWVEAQITNLSGALFNWLESDQSTPDLAIELGPIKARLLGESLDQAVEVFVDSWPSCTPEQVETFKLAFEQGNDFPPFVCEPPEPLRGSVVDLATRALASETQSLPDRIPLVTNSEVDLQQMRSAKASLLRLRTVLSVIWMVPVSALGVIMALKIRGRRDLGRWWGLTIFFSGAAAIVLNLILRASRSEVLRGLYADLGSPGTVQFELARAVLQGAVSETLGLMLMHAFLIALIGAGAWFILARKAADQAAGQTEFDPGMGSSSARFVGRELAEKAPPPIPPFESQVGDEDDRPSGIFG